MPIEIIIALFSLVGTLAGTFGGILASNRLTTYRIGQLEKKVETHNNLVDRMYGAESRLEKVDQSVRSAHHRIDDLRDEIKEEK